MLKPQMSHWGYILNGAPTGPRPRALNRQAAPDVAPEGNADAGAAAAEGGDDQVASRGGPGGGNIRGVSDVF